MDVFSAVDELVDLCKIMNESIVFAQAKSENCCHVKSLSLIIYKKIEELQKQMHA